MHTWMGDRIDGLSSEGGGWGLVISLEFISWEQMVNGGLPEDAQESPRESRSTLQGIRRRGGSRDRWVTLVMRGCSRD